MTTGFPHADAAAAFARERRRHRLSKVGARLRLVRDPAAEMLPLEQVVDDVDRVSERDLGLKTIALESIVGTAGRRACEFDGRFRPTSRRTERRWLSVALARRRGQALPPIDVVRVGELHFVQDGHHRVSVARAEGDRVIDARVREIRTRRPATRPLDGLPELSPLASPVRLKDDQPSKGGGYEVRAADLPRTGQPRGAR